MDQVKKMDEQFKSFQQFMMEELENCENPKFSNYALSNEEIKDAKYDSESLIVVSKTYYRSFMKDKNHPIFEKPLQNSSDEESWKDLEENIPDMEEKLVNKQDAKSEKSQYKIIIQEPMKEWGKRIEEYKQIEAKITIKVNVETSKRKEYKEKTYVIPDYWRQWFVMNGYGEKEIRNGELNRLINQCIVEYKKQLMEKLTNILHGDVMQCNNLKNRILNNGKGYCKFRLYTDDGTFT